MSRILLNGTKLFLAVLAPIALAGSIQAGSPDARDDSRFASRQDIVDAQSILEHNRYLARGDYNQGTVDSPTTRAIVLFQNAHTLLPTGTLDRDTTALLWSHARGPRETIATAVTTGPTYVYRPAIVYRPTSEPLFVEKRPLILSGVEFDIDQATLRPESRTTLDQVAASLHNWPGVMVEIQGHTSEPGTAIHNMALSQRRAEAVRAYFVSKGIDGARLVANGYGQTRFAAENVTAEGRQENRRVELHEIQ